MEEKPPRVVLKKPRTAKNYQELPYGMQSWENSNGFSVLSIPYHADPEKDNWEWFSAAKKGLRDDQFRQEVLIDFTARGGTKVFPFLEAHRDKYLVKPWAEIPYNMTIIAGLDFGSRNPTSILMCAVNEKGHFHVFSEYYEPSSPAKIARYLKNHPYFDRILKISADPSIFNKDQHELDGTIRSRADIIQDLGIHNLEPATNDRLVGLERVKYMFRYSADSPELKPYLTISEDCQNLWRELTGLTYKEETQRQLLDRNPSEDTVKKHDHAYDALKYALLSWAVPSDFQQKPAMSEFCLARIETDLEDREEQEKYTLLGLL